MHTSTEHGGRYTVPKHARRCALALAVVPTVVYRTPSLPSAARGKREHTQHANVSRNDGHNNHHHRRRNMADTTHDADQPTDTPIDTLIDADELATPTPRIAGSCSNPNWQPTTYEPYQP